MKTPEELNALKEEVEILNRKLRALREDELEQVSCGYRGVAQGNILRSVREPVVIETTDPETITIPE